MLVVIARQERDTSGSDTVLVPEWPDFDSEMLPEITRALAILAPWWHSPKKSAG
jgi:hypothetical protein